MMRIKKLLLLLLTAAALLLPAGCGEDPDAWETPASDFTYEIVDGGVQITAYTGSRAWVRIPAAIDGAPVVAIGEKAFFRAGITELSIPESVTEIGRSAFTGNEKLCTVEMQNDPAGWFTSVACSGGSSNGTRTKTGRWCSARTFWRFVHTIPSGPL